MCLAGLLLAFSASTALAAPANDNFAGAETLSGSSASATGSNVDATKEAGEPNHAGNAGGSSVWYRWTAPADGPVRIDTCASGFDTVLAVYTGGDVATLDPVASSDDACEVRSRVTFAAANGQAYSIAVDGYAGQTGSITLALEHGDAAQTFDVTAEARHVSRSRRVDATKFLVNSSVELFSARLVLVSGDRRIRVDLELEDEGDFLDDRSFEYTFRWSCPRGGTWRWTITATTLDESSGEESRRVLEGLLEVPACTTRPWFVSAGTAKRKIRRDFGLGSNARVGCRAVGRRRGRRSDAWRCTLRIRGLTCRGSFLIRSSRTTQGGDVIAQRLSGSGGAECTG